MPSRITFPPPNFISSPEREVALDLDKIGIGKPHAIAGSGSEVVGVLMARDSQAHDRLTI